MAANDYYERNHSTRPQYDLDFNPSFDTPSRSQPSPPSRTISTRSNRGESKRPPKSPFDDSEYGYRSPSPYVAQESQQSLGGESAYYGNQERTSDHGHYADDIPLRDQASKLSTNSADGLPGPVSDPPRRKGMKRFFGGSGRVTWVVYILTLIQISVFIAEIVKNSVLTKSPIEIHPTFNPMIGPSQYVLINMGARFVPCMRSTIGIQDSKSTINWPCPNITTTDVNDPSNQCTLSDLCGFSGVPNPKVGGSINDQPQPDQWFRFVVPIFLHAGIIHIAFNMLLQLTLGRDMEKLIGPLRFFIVYFSAGIFGFVLGGNFAPSGIASTGASGSLFGILALTLVDLLFRWREHESPWVELAWIGFDVVLSFVLGLLPGLDNFSHIGGFLMGLGMGICILHSPVALRERIGGVKPYEPVMAGALGGLPDDQDDNGVKAFAKQPVGFFKGRKLLWWVWWLLRAGALVGVLIAFIVLLNNFYKYRVQCNWCKHLSCLPIKNWCDLGNLQFNNNSTNNKRDLYSYSMVPGIAPGMAQGLLRFL